MANSIEQLIEQFESHAKVDEDGVQFWFARDLQVLLEYSQWRNFEEVIEKAKIACEGAGQPAINHFADVSKMVTLGSGSEREIKDIKLNRYACYLIAQNGDSRKKSIAFAQTYFAMQTRRKELDDQQLRSLSPEQKRLLLRNELKTHNKSLADVAKSAGVVEPLDYAIFQNHGYKGLYNGIDRRGIQAKKGLNKNQDILDFMGSEELAANLFRATQTESKIKREKIKGKLNANKAHFEVGKKVRQTIKELGGTMPEELEPAEDIKKLERRVKTDDKKLSKEASKNNEHA